MALVDFFKIFSSSPKPEIDPTQQSTNPLIPQNQPIDPMKSPLGGMSGPLGGAPLGGNLGPKL
jgi:hypothetical protein